MWLGTLVSSILIGCLTGAVFLAIILLSVACIMLGRRVG